MPRIFLGISCLQHSFYDMPFIKYDWLRQVKRQSAPPAERAEFMRKCLLLVSKGSLSKRAVLFVETFSGLAQHFRFRVNAYYLLERAAWAAASLAIGTLKGEQDT